MALTGGDEIKQEMRMAAGALLYDSIENLDQEHHLMRPGSGGGGGATVTPPGFGGGSKPKAAAVAAAAGGGGYGRNNSTCGIRYRECLKNHAAAIGGNVTDGCGEFMPSGEDGSLEAFKCAACSCHRNFHRKEGGAGENAAMVVHPLQLTPPLHGSGGGNHHWTSSMVHPMKMAFGGSGGGGSGSAATDSSSEELNFNVYQSSGAAPPPQFVVAKKRHRTKFSVDQKEKMLAFAEKLGWRIPREDDTEVQRFCGEVGVKRQVFKVWMHNNKNSASSAKKTMTPPDHHQHQHQHQHHEQQQQQQQLHHE